MNIDLYRLATNVEAASTGALKLQRLAPATPPDAVLYDICGRRRSPATLRSFRLGVAPANKGKRYPATPPTSQQILDMLEVCPNNPAGRRLKATMTLLWRSGLRASEGLALTRHDLDPENGTVTVQHGKGDKYRVVGMDPWAFEQIAPWLDERYKCYPDGPVFCIVQGPTKGGPWSTSALRTDVRKVAFVAGVPKRVAPHQLRHAHACEMAREQIPLVYVSKQLGHSNLSTTTTYLSGMGSDEIVAAIVARPAPGGVA